MNGLEPSDAPITLAIVSTNYLVRLGLQGVINTQQHIRLIGEATSTLEAEELAARETPQALIIEMEPEIDIIELVRRVKTSAPTTKIILLSGIEDKHRTLGALSSGIDGIVLNVQPAVVLLATIGYVCRLRTWTEWHEPHATNQPERNGTTGGKDRAKPASSKYPDASLTEHEQEIIALVGQALSNKDIADRLCISSITVRHHLTSIFDKLGVTSRQKLILRAHQYGLMELRALA